MRRKNRPLWRSYCWRWHDNGLQTLIFFSLSFSFFHQHKNRTLFHPSACQKSFLSRASQTDRIPRNADWEKQPWSRRDGLESRQRVKSFLNARINGSPIFFLNLKINLETSLPLYTLAQLCQVVPVSNICIWKDSTNRLPPLLFWRDQLDDQMDEGHSRRKKTIVRSIYLLIPWVMDAMCGSSTWAGPPIPSVLFRQKQEIRFMFCFLLRQLVPRRSY